MGLEQSRCHSGTQSIAGAARFDKHLGAVFLNFREGADAKKTGGCKSLPERQEVSSGEFCGVPGARLSRRGRFSDHASNVSSTSPAASFPVRTEPLPDKR